MMDVKKRLLRGPLRTILWQIVLIAMALLIGVGGALVYSSEQLTTVLDDHHTTIAAQKQRYEQIEATTWRYYPSTLFQSDIEMLEGLDMVEKVDLRTLTGAYIPELTARIGLQPWGDLFANDVDEFAQWNANTAYKRVVIAGTVERTWMSDYDSVYDYNLSQVGGAEFTETKYMNALVSVDALLVGHPDNYYFPNDTYSKYTGKVIVNIPVYWAGEENFFQEGERYMIQGSYDQRVSLRDGDIMVSDLPASPHLGIAYTLSSTGTSCFIRGDELISYDSYEADADVSPFDVSMSNRGTETILSLSEEKTPIAVKLDTSVEEFLAEPDNAHWAQIVEQGEMLLHSFPVLGTEALESMYVFLSNGASMVAGRFFTQAEYDAGEKVCIISESVAASGGIQVGDTLTVSQFLCGSDYQEGNYSVDMDTDGMLNNPSIGFLALERGLATENEAFTVVGIYRLENEWENSEYAITPNTIFIPQKSQIQGGFGGPSYTTEVMETYRITTSEGVVEERTELQTVIVDNGVVGIYLSVVLKNGQMEAFTEAIGETELADRLFLTFDQGYEAAQESVQAVIHSARDLFLAVAAGWGLLLLLYVLLYQSRERRNLGIMRSVGAQSTHLRRYLFASGLIPAAAGITIGTLLSGQAASLVRDKLVSLTLLQAQSSAHSGGMMLENSQLSGMLAQSELSAMGTLLLAVIQIVVIGAVLWVHAWLLTRKSARKLLGV